MASSRIKGDSLRRVIQLMLLVLPLLLHVSVAQNCGSQGGGALCQQSGYCCSTFGYCGNSAEYCGASNCQSQCPSSPSPGGGSGVASIVTSTRFDQIFPNRNSFYTYNAFIAAANSFPAFGTTGDSTARGREIAAFFAHVTHETSGLQFIEEITPASDYCQASNTEYPCASGKRYYGRGPLQLSWNYNYGPAGQSIGQDLLSNPDLVAQDPTVSFQTALWFWMTAQSPKPSCHNVMVGNWNPSAADVAAGRQPGFGVTIDIINGGIECGPGATRPDLASSRVSSYQFICTIFGVDPGNNLVCTNMQPF